MGLAANSVIVTDNLATVHWTAITKVVGTCPIMAPIDAALRKTLGLGSGNSGDWNDRH